MQRNFFSISKSLSKKIEVGVLVLCALLLFCLFSYVLDNTALASFDEAWYGTITRNLVHSKDPFLLKFNGVVFSDHPPLGFVLMAVPTFFLGSSEYSVRLTSVLCGVASILLIYLLGKRFSGRMVGTAAALVVFSSLWFVFRTRTGNLDVPFLFWELLTVYLATHKNDHLRYYSLVSFSALFLTKTLVGVGLLPLLIYSFWSNRQNVNFKKLGVFCVLSLCCILPWYIVNQLHDSKFLLHHFFEVGVRGQKNTFGVSAVLSSLRYLAIGMGVWFKVFLLSSFLGALALYKHTIPRRHVILLMVWFFGFSVFFLSSKTEIWHLIPVYPVVAFMLSLFFVQGIKAVTSSTKQATIGKIALLTFFLALAFFEWKKFFPLLYKQTPEFNFEKDISMKVRTYQNLFILETFFPAAAYYSNQNVLPLAWKDHPYEDLLTLLGSKNGESIIINGDTKKQLENDHIHFSVLESNSQYFLITK